MAIKTSTQENKFQNAWYFIGLPYIFQVASEFVIHAAGAYNIPNIKFDVELCRTNLPFATAMRGFGAPQAVYVLEQVILAVAEHLQMSTLQVIESDNNNNSCFCISQQPRHY